MGATRHCQRTSPNRLAAVSMSTSMPPDHRPYIPNLSEYAHDVPSHEAAAFSRKIVLVG